MIGHAARSRLLVALAFGAVASGLALVRFRCSPAYPAFNDVNSDVYVYQVVGNSWTHGLFPYRDVYDVKGPFLYLLFGLFARLRPWSMGPPLVLLILLSFASLCLAYAIARVHLLRRPLAALAAVASCLVTYLSVAAVASSFTCEELAVPGVLLLLWLVTRWWSDGEDVADGWWFVDGTVLGALFWSKYQVITPWAGVLVALALVVVRGQGSARRLVRVVVLHLAGSALTTVVVLSCYAPVLPELLRAYFLAKRGNVDFARELPAEAVFAATVVRQNPAAVLALAAVLAMLLLRARRGASREGAVLTMAFCLSSWASTAFVRHQNNLFVPLSFCAVAVPYALQSAQSRGPAVTRVAAAGLALLSAGACVAPLAQSVTSYGLFRQSRALTCYDLSTLVRDTRWGGVSTAFARTARNRPILSVGTLFAARSSYVSKQPMARPFEFVDASWSTTIGANQVQARYVQQRTFDYVWITIPGIDKFHDLRRQIAVATHPHGGGAPAEAAALSGDYVPVLGCNSEILLRARRP